MFDLAWRFIQTEFGLTDRQAHEVYKRIVIMLTVVMFAWLVMLGINIWISMEMNHILVWLKVLLLAIACFAPRAVLASMVIGMGLNSLEGKELKPGAVRGMKLLKTAVLIVLFVDLLVSVALATIPFGNHPSSFFAIAGCALLLAVMYAVWPKKNMPRTIVTVMVAGIIGFNVWKLVPWEEVEGSLPNVSQGSDDSTIIHDHRVVAVNFTIPANTTEPYTIDRPSGLTCNVDDISTARMENISRVGGRKQVEYMSDHATEIEATIWFFNKRSETCLMDAKELLAQGAFDPA